MQLGSDKMKDNYAKAYKDNGKTAFNEEGNLDENIRKIL